MREVAQCVSTWGYARLFAECINKLHFNPSRYNGTLDEQAFEQLVSRFEQYLENTEDQTTGRLNHGLLVHDNNQTVAKKHTDLMRRFHRQGTLWTRIQRLIETPLFVDSSLTRLVQIADHVRLRIAAVLGESGSRPVRSDFLKGRPTRQHGRWRPSFY